MIILEYHDTKIQEEVIRSGKSIPEKEYKYTGNVILKIYQVRHEVELSSYYPLKV